jgi:hypothetical protein
MATKKVHTLEYNNRKYILTIEKKPYILDKTIQPVYRYYIDDKEVLTYYTNGSNKILYPVYNDNDNETYNKDMLDTLLVNLLPK